MKYEFRLIWFMDHLQQKLNSTPARPISSRGSNRNYEMRSLSSEIICKLLPYDEKTATTCVHDLHSSMLDHGSGAWCQGDVHNGARSGKVSIKVHSLLRLALAPLTCDYNVQLNLSHLWCMLTNSSCVIHQVCRAGYLVYANRRQEQLSLKMPQSRFHTQLMQCLTLRTPQCH